MSQITLAPQKFAKYVCHGTKINSPMMDVYTGQVIYAVWQHKENCNFKTNNIYDIPKSITDLCVKIRLWEPRAQEVAQLIAKIEKATGHKANYTKVTNDFRRSINNCFANGEACVQATPFEETEAFFRKQQITQLNENHAIWLMDNATNFYGLPDVFLMSQLLEACDRLQSFKPLTVLPKGKMGAKAEFPRYFQRAKYLKKETKDANKK